MIEIKRMAKRISILTIYIFLIALIGSAVYFFIIPNPSCYDNKKNQGEKDIDCGGPCLPCKEPELNNKVDFVSAEFIPNKEGGYDAAVLVKNSNDIVGSGHFKFRLVFGNEATSQWEDGFILPGEQKYLFIYGISGISTEQMTAGATLEITDADWKKFIHYEEPDFISVNTEFFDQVDNLPDYSQVRGTLVNSSQIDFETVKVKVLLKSINGKIIGINHQIINTLRANERRDFVVNFPKDISEQVSDIIVEPETNIFDSDNYIRIYGDPKNAN